MTNVAFAAFDRLCTNIGIGSWKDNRKVTWEFFASWDYAQTNDQMFWKDDRHADGLIEADALIKNDVHAGFQKFLSLAEAGSVWAMENAGYCYDHERGVTRDSERAEYWYRCSYEAGCTRALLDLGRLLSRQGKLDAAEAVYIAGAGKGWAPAMCHLARLRLKQSPSREGYLSIYPLLESASEQGSPAALWFLARYMSRGCFGVLNIPKGVALAFKAGDTMRKLVDGETSIKREWPSMSAGTA